MKTLSTHLAIITVLGGLVAAAQTACVSGSTYELAKSNAENAKLLYQNEQRRSQELVATNKRMKQQIDDLESNLRISREQLERKDKEWREARDELLRMKIDKEQQRHKSRDRLTEASPRPEVVEKAGPASDFDSRPKSQAQSEDAKRRVKELLEQLQGLLDQN